MMTACHKLQIARRKRDIFVNFFSMSKLQPIFRNYFGLISCNHRVSSDLSLAFFIFCPYHRVCIYYVFSCMANMNMDLVTIFFNITLLLFVPILLYNISVLIKQFSFSRSTIEIFICTHIGDSYFESIFPSAFNLATI